jgi:F-type H+-transporting ATPase subunit epsilon
MAETTYLELVTPARIMAQKDVQMVVAPGVEGLFGVLPRHAPLFADLARGVVEVHEDGKVTDRYMIDGGLADVSGESVTILAERAVNLGTADAAKIRESAAGASGAEADFLNAVAAAL